MGVVKFHLVGRKKETEEIFFLPLSKRHRWIGSVFVSEALATVWHYSLFCLNIKCASLHLLPAM